MKVPTLQDRFRGALIGLAVGDAIGATNEFAPRGGCNVRDMVGGGPWRLRPGDWTDDTAMAFALGESLATRGRFDPRDIMDNWSRWSRGDAFCGTHGRGCFDIGGTTSAALLRFRETGDPWQGRPDPNSCANGCLMRFAPVALFAFARPRAERLQLAADSCRLTHGTALCVQATQMLGEILHALLDGVEAGQHGEFDFRFVTERPLIAVLARAAWDDADGRRIRSTGYVVDTLEAAMWAAQTRPEDAAAEGGPFAAGILRAANLGGDADTVAAVAGQMLGASYGYEAIPLRWRARLDRHDDLLAVADRLFELATAGEKPARLQHCTERNEIGEAGA
jgi:ADP-ribosyl-[dinitrogen reductase] hydrolase